MIPEEVRPHFDIPAILEYLEQTADAKGKKLLAQCIADHRDEKAPEEAPAEEAPAEK